MVLLQTFQDYNIFMKQIVQKIRTMNYANGFHEQSHLLTQSVSHQISPRVNQLNPIQNSLKSTVFKLRVQQIVKQFISKTRRNSTFLGTTQKNYIEVEGQSQRLKIFYKCYFNWIKKASKIQGFQIGIMGLISLNVINFIQFLLLAFILSITLTFHQAHEHSSFTFIRLFGLMFSILNSIVNMTAKKFVRGKTLHSVGQIFSNYIKKQFSLDMIVISLLLLNLFTFDQQIFDVILLFLVMFKLSKTVRKLGKLKHIIIETSEQEHFYGLIKVFITNFAIAHFVSIFLNLMTSFDSEKNWHTKVQIQNEEWNVKYIWGYYWGTSIMLTVGFGDISANNYYQAFSLIFVQILSCIIISYNICQIGALISSLRQKQKQKQQKLKTFHSICKQNGVSNQVELKISNFVEDKHRAHQIYQFDQEQLAVQELPVPIKRQLNKQKANYHSKLLQNMSFFTLFSNKFVKQIASKLQRKIYNPQQIIFSRGDIQGCNLYILHKGAIGFICSIDSILEGKQMYQMRVENGEKPKIISFNFIRNTASNYNLKSNGSSVVYFLTRDQFMECLQKNSSSSQMFFMLKDSRSQRYGYTCEMCGLKNHTKFDCTRLHYNPSNQQVIARSLKTTDNSKNFRRNDRQQKTINVSLKQVFKTKIHKNKKMMDKKEGQIIKGHEDIKQSNIKQSNYVPTQTTELQCDRINNFKSYFIENNLYKIVRRYTKKKYNSMWQ